MTIKDARLSIIDQRLHAVSYARPADYLRFLQHVAHITTNDDAFAEYVEIKATRDIIVHSAGIANSIYTTKVGPKARVDAGVRPPMDADYFDHCVATVKRISVIVKEDIEQHFT